MLIPQLRKWRERQGLTQKELAERAGVSPRAVAGYETGDGTRPNTARKLADALDVDVADLMEEESPKEVTSRNVEDYLRSLRAYLSSLDDDEFTRAVEARVQGGTLRAMVSEMSKERARVREARAKNPGDPVVVAADKRATHRTAAVVGRWTMETFGLTREEAEEKAAEAEQVWEEVIAS